VKQTSDAVCGRRRIVFFTCRFYSLSRNGQYSLKLKSKTRQAMYVKRNIEAHSFNQACSGKAISITYSECVFVALGI
jgi:hypothetical protein